MSSRLSATAVPTSRISARCDRLGGGSAGTQLGVGMLEFLFALLIFSTGMTGLLATQLVGQRTIFEANQRSLATALAADIVARILANPAQVDAYTLNLPQVTAEGVPLPAADCYSTNCSARDLAAYDIWQWTALLRGVRADSHGSNRGGLASPGACISANAGVVTVAISWFGNFVQPNTTSAKCDGAPAESAAAGAYAANPMQQRRRLVLSTYVPGH